MKVVVTRFFLLVALVAIAPLAAASAVDVNQATVHAYGEAKALRDATVEAVLDSAAEHRKLSDNGMRLDEVAGSTWDDGDDTARQQAQNVDRMAVHRLGILDQTSAIQTPGDGHGGEGAGEGGLSENYDEHGDQLDDPAPDTEAWIDFVDETTLLALDTGAGTLNEAFSESDAATAPVVERTAPLLVEKIIGAADRNADPCIEEGLGCMPDVDGDNHAAGGIIDGSDQRPMSAGSLPPEEDQPESGTMTDPHVAPGDHDHMHATDPTPEVGTPGSDEPQPDTVGSAWRAQDLWSDSAFLAVSMATVALTALVLWRLVSLGLFSRITKDTVLDHPVRHRIYQILGREPGLHREQLVRRIECSRTVLDHHATKLVDAGLLNRVTRGGFVCYFRAGQVDRSEMSAMPFIKAPAARKVLALLLENPGITSALVSKRTDLSKTLVSYHVDRLTKGGLIQKERQGRCILLTPTPQARKLLRGQARD